MKRPSVLLPVYVFLVFLSGALVGVAGHRLYATRGVSADAQPTSPEDFRRQYVQEMTSRLKLNAEQVSQLNVILDDTRARYRSLKDKYKPEMKTIQEEQVQKVREFLSEEQRVEYEKLRKEREARRKAHDRPSPGF